MCQLYAGTIKIAANCTQYDVKSIRENRRRMKLAFDMRGGLIGVFQGGRDGRQTLSGRSVGWTDGDAVPAWTPAAARVNYKLLAVVLSDVRSDETVGRASSSNLLQIQLRRAALFASHLSPMMNWPVSTHYGSRGAGRYTWVAVAITTQPPQLITLIRYHVASADCKTMRVFDECSSIVAVDVCPVYMYCVIDRHKMIVLWIPVVQ